MGSLNNRKDLDRSATASEHDNADFIKLDEGVNFIVLLDPNYEEGFEHWIKIDDRTSARGVCAGGMEGKGWAPDDCKACGKAKDHFDTKKELLDEGDEEAAKLENDAGSNLRSNYRAFFKALKGTKIHTKNSKGKMVERPDWSESVPQKLGITESMMEMLRSLIDDERYDMVQDGEDLVGLILKFDKQKAKNKKGKSYLAVKEIYPVGKYKGIKEVEGIDEVNIEEEFTVDKKALDKILARLEEGGDYEEEEYDESEADEELDADEEEEEEEEESEEEDDDAEEEEQDDDDFFEDDDEEEEEAPKKKKKSSKGKKKPELKKKGSKGKKKLASSKKGSKGKKKKRA